MEDQATENAIGLASVLTVVVGGLGAWLSWLDWRDRRQSKALRVRADINLTVNRQLKGESLVSVQVMAASPWRAGRVTLRAPSGWEAELAEVSAPVLRRLPDGYELVLHVQHACG